MYNQQREKLVLTNNDAVLALDGMSSKYTLIEDKIVSLERHYEKRRAVLEDTETGKFYGGYYNWEDEDRFRFYDYNDWMELYEVHPKTITIYV